MPAIPGIRSPFTPFGKAWDCFGDSSRGPFNILLKNSLSQAKACGYHKDIILIVKKVAAPFRVRLRRYNPFSTGC